MLVFTPGRVGTVSLQHALSSNFDIVHMHDPSKTQSLDNVKRDVESARIINERLGKLDKVDGKLNIVTSVRDPIARAISAFSYFYVHWGIPSSNFKLHFLDNYAHDWALNWFDVQFKGFTDIDVYLEGLDNTHKA